MPVPLYLDECVNRHLSEGLHQRGIDATTAVQEGTLGLDDESQLLFATRLGRMILSHNQKHFLRLHAQFAREHRAHAGILLLPNGPLPLLELRVAMLLSWIDVRNETGSRLVRWHDLQAELTGGSGLSGFDEVDIRRALMIDPIIG